MHAFADESRRGDYLVCAATIAPADLTDARKALKALRAPKASRIHMSAARAARRERAAGALADRIQQLPTPDGRRDCSGAGMPSCSPSPPRCPSSRSPAFAGTR